MGCLKYNRIIYFSLFFLITILFAQIINADVLSLNFGGSENITINSNTYIEGFFLGGASTVEEEVPTTTPSTGGGGGSSTPKINVSLDPEVLNINLAINTNVEQIITVKNHGKTSVNLSISQEDLKGMVFIDADFFYLKPGEVKNLIIAFVARNNTGIFTGKIKIGGEEVLVSLNVRTKLLLFDTNIVVLNEDYLVEQGEELKTSIDLIPVGEKERLDVVLNYVIKDYENKTYLTKSETIFIEEQTLIKRNFDTGFLPFGKYVVGLELVYPNGVATSSAHFEVVEKSSSLKTIYFIILGVLLLIMTIIGLLIYLSHHWENEKQKLRNLIDLHKFAEST